MNETQKQLMDALHAANGLTQALTRALDLAARRPREAAAQLVTAGTRLNMLAAFLADAEGALEDQLAGIED